jgi:transglutaminase-like putative cysteine protease/tetratricopeptide (TPR) repeat protein
MLYKIWENIFQQTLISGILGILVFAGCGGGIAPLINKDLVPKEYQKEFESALSLSGDNKEQLVSAMRSVSPEMRKGLSFIIATMSYPDLVAIKSDVLLEHIKYAYLVKNKYPWMKNMPEEIFLHYVLPYRCAEEPIEAYRKYFYEQLDPIVSQLTNLADVAHQVNLWLGSPRAKGNPRVRFVPTEARDQGPLETLRAGYGRCEEMMIVYMASARSVGVPCRSAWTPYWAICDNNHAWVEVWIDGYWKPLGGCEPGVSPWFEHPAKRAAAVYSATIGQPRSELIHKTLGNFSIINSTQNYSHTCKVNVNVIDENNKPVTNTTVVFAVFNWGSFRPFATKITDPEGKVQFVTGIGEYFLSTGRDNRRAWQVVKTEPDKPLDITLKLSAESAPDGYLFLRYPSIEQAKASFTTSGIAPVHLQPLTPVYNAPAEIYFCDEFSPTMHSDVMMFLEAYSQKDAVVQKLKSAGGNWHQIADAIKEINPELRNDLFYLITQLAHLEALEVTKEFLLDNVNLSKVANGYEGWNIPEDIYRSYVLNPQFQYLHISNWRKELRSAFMTIRKGHRYNIRRVIPLKADTITDCAKSVNEWVAANIKLRNDLSGRFSYVASPLDTLRSKVGDARGIAIFTAALLRTLAIPAQVKNEWVEFWNGTEWLPVYPLDPKNFANRMRDDKTALEYETKPAGIKFNLTRRGVVDANHWEKVAVSRFQNSCWQYLDRDDLKRYGKWMAIQPGQYLVTAGVRNSNGDAMVYCKQLEFKSGQGIVLNIPMDIPIDKLPESDRMVRKLDKVPMFELPDIDGNDHNLGNILKTHSVVLSFFSLDNEPSIRMLPLIERTKETAREVNALILAVYVDSEGRNKFLSDSRLKSLQLPVLLDSTQEVVKQFIPEFEKNKNKCLPSTLLIKEGKILMWYEGYNMAIDNLIESACAGLLETSSPEKQAGRMPGPKISYEPFVVGPDYVGEAERYFKEGNYVKAIESYKEALNLNPDDANIWYNLACAFSLSGKIDEGLEALRKSLEYGWSDLYWMDNDPDLALLRNDPRYKEIRK